MTMSPELPLNPSYNDKLYPSYTPRGPHISSSKYAYMGHNASTAVANLFYFFSQKWQIRLAAEAKKHLPIDNKDGREISETLADKFWFIDVQVVYLLYKVFFFLREEEKEDRWG